MALSLVLPLQAYMWEGEPYRVVDEAINMLAERCMEREGFDVDVTSAASEYPDAATCRRSSALGDRETASRWGYHLPGVLGEPDEDSATCVPNLSAAALDALSGDVLSNGPGTRGGCLGEAGREPRAGEDGPIPGDDPEFATALNFESHIVTERDQDVDHAQGLWGDFMAGGGYRRTGTMDGLDVDGVDISAAVVPVGEVEMALWDVGCQERSGIVGVWFEAEAECQSRKIGEDAEALARVEADNEALVRRAAAVLGGAG